MFRNGHIIHRYVIREYLYIFSLSLSSLLLIYLVVLFFQKVSQFVEYKAPIHLIFLYLLYKIPEAIFQWTLPYGVLLATLLTLGILSRNSEITAMKAGGVSLYRITFPLFFIVFFISIASFLGNEFLVPLANQKTRYLLKVQLQGEATASSFKNYNIWYRSNNRIFSIQLVDPKKKMLNGFTLFKIDDQFQCIQRVDANEVKWMNGKWIFFKGTVRSFDQGGSIRTMPFDKIELILPENWESFQGIEQESEEMSYTELRNYVQRIRAAGYDPTRYLVDLYAKFSYPFLNFIMILIGTPFALKTSRSGGVALNIGVSVLIGFVYGVTFYVFLTFGKSGVLPPMLSAWIPIVLFGLAGIFTLMSVRQ